MLYLYRTSVSIRRNKARVADICICRWLCLESNLKSLNSHKAAIRYLHLEDRKAPSMISLIEWSVHCNASLQLINGGGDIQLATLQA